MPQYLTEPAALSSIGGRPPHTLRIFASAIKPAPKGEFIREQEQKLLDICLISDGSPCSPRIKTLIKARLGPEWQLVDWWMPEPQDEF
jgi:hypothetical protein